MGRESNPATWYNFPKIIRSHILLENNELNVVYTVKFTVPILTPSS